ncbi:hypothetical protein ACTHGU_14620 [Chitinophagaceae bacterium MMS25-I14]
MLQKIAEYFREYPVVIIEDLSAVNVENINALLDNAVPERVIIVKSIHRNILFSDNWKQISSRPEVTLSMDLYNYGLLFSREEFLVKQHFVIKT